mmetsp:Transcript_65214/g.194951  ORF Transcript_65214/g.194951 Transcript_65214/m.194951 type:complete len:100 (+) Transcript_65214:706-1005(+)
MIVYKYQRMKYMFMIPQDRMVRGDVRVNCGNHEVDVATLEAGFGAGPSEMPRHSLDGSEGIASGRDVSTAGAIVTPSAYEYAPAPESRSAPLLSPATFT